MARIVRRSRPYRALLAGMLLAGPFLAPATEAQGKNDRCELEFRQLDDIEDYDGYDPYGHAPVAQHRFVVRNTDGPSCAYAVTVDWGQRGNRTLKHGNQFLSYQLYKDASAQVPLADDDGPAAGWFTGTLAPDQEHELVFFSHIPPGQMVTRDNFRDRIEFTLYELEDGLPGRRQETERIWFETYAVVSVQVSVDLGSGRRPLSGMVGTLDLGDLNRDGTATFDLVISGNGEYDIYLSSENRGELRAAGIGAGIPYSLWVNGQWVRLNQGEDEIAVSGGPGQTHSLRVQVGDVSRALAGTYQDNLTLTVEAD